MCLANLAHSRDTLSLSSSFGTVINRGRRETLTFESIDGDKVRGQ